jgi:hypothetical protein
MIDLYPYLRQALFRFDPEVAHARVFALLAFAAEHPGALRLLHATTGVHDPACGSARSASSSPTPSASPPASTRTAWPRPSGPRSGSDTPSSAP